MFFVQNIVRFSNQMICPTSQPPMPLESFQEDSEESEYGHGLLCRLLQQRQQIVGNFKDPHESVGQVATCASRAIENRKRLQQLVNRFEVSVAQVQVSLAEPDQRPHTFQVLKNAGRPLRIRFASQPAVGAVVEEWSNRSFYGMAHDSDEGARTLKQEHPLWISAFADEEGTVTLSRACEGEVDGEGGEKKESLGCSWV